MRNIHLHGALGDKFGKVYRLDVATAGEAVRALGANFPTFIAELQNGAWHVVRGDDIDTGLSLGEDAIVDFNLGRGDLHIVPYIAGSKSGSGVMKIILGVALVGLSLFMGPATAVFGGAALQGFTYANVGMIGLGLALSGVSSLLAPDEKSDEDKQSSFTFSGPGNTYDQGNPVPLVYGGPVIVGSLMISGGVDVEKIAVGA